jgi:monoamine oxidase
MSRRVRIIVAGAGLAGLTAARALERAGADVTVVEARQRVGGRIYTLRDGLEAGQHVELGADLIEEEQTEVLALAKELDLEPVRILRGGFGFYGRSDRGRARISRTSDAFERAKKLLEPEIAAYTSAGSRWDSGVAQAIARQSAADGLRRVRADRALAAGICGLRGFFLADPDDLSLLPVVDQFAQGVPGQSRMYRLRGGNDTLPIAIARGLRGRVLLGRTVRRVTQTTRGVRVAVRGERSQELTADYAVMALPASTLTNVTFSPALPRDQRRAIASLRYGPATRVVLQFEDRFWKSLIRPSAFGTDQPFGAVWDGNEEQSRSPGILTLLAGGRASKAVQEIVGRGGWPAIVTRLAWLGTPSTLLAALLYDWEQDRWSKGGYAVFDPRFDPALRAWLARPAGRVCFAGEHTSQRWQGFMSGAIESGRRAAIEVAIAAALDYGRIASA